MPLDASCVQEGLQVSVSPVGVFSLGRGTKRPELRWTLSRGPSTFVDFHQAFGSPRSWGGGP